MATYADKTLKCIECGSDFTYAASEQELHASLGYQNEPKRCTPCRDAKRQRKGGGGGGGGGRGAAPAGPGGPPPAAAPRGRGGRNEGGGGGSREYFMAICGGCGKEAQLPFKPRGDRPVYCGECFAQKRAEVM